MAGCLDLDAPIVPGQSAAGIALGSAVRAALGACAGDFSEQQVVNTCLQLPTDIMRYSSGPVVLWVREGIVEQIQVRHGYRGSLPGEIGIGAALAEVEARLGALEEDEDGNLVLAQCPGIALQASAPHRGAPAADRSGAHIAACFVFRVE